MRLDVWFVRLKMALGIQRVHKLQLLLQAAARTHVFSRSSPDASQRDVCMFLHTSIHPFMHTYMHAYMHAYMHTCIHAYVHT